VGRCLRLKSALKLTAFTGLGCLVLHAQQAHAQATGTLTVEQVEVTASQNNSFEGVVSQQESPKTREIITQQYISQQPTGANALSDLNLVPGVNYTNDDPYGMSGVGGHLSIRGIKGANIAEMVDGVPLNDAGNYAIYGGELVDPEVISNVNVITGSTDVDSPTSSSLGGSVNINTLTPSDTMGGFVTGSGGSFNYWRVAGLVNTGEVGPWGTKMWIEGSQQMNDKFTGVGHDKKWQVNFKIYQDLHHADDFIALAGFYDQQLADFYFGDDFASYTTSTTVANPHPVYTGGFNYNGTLGVPWNSDYSKTYVLPSSTSANSMFQGVEENPTYTGNLRGASRFTIFDNLHLTIDPSYQWVLANGEGSTNISGTDARLVGSGLTTNLSNYQACTNAAGVITGLDLDGATSGGDPVCTDSVRLLSPSNTQTNRLTLNTSLIWNITPDHLVQFSYAWDHANVKQTGEYGQLQPDGYPDSIFGGLPGYGTPILAADGTTFQKRNRKTVAELDQGAVEYIGHYFDNSVRVDIGLRDPFFSRDLNQLCYTQPASNVYCTAFASIANAQNPAYPVSPFHIHTNYNKLLPNAGVTWNIDDVNSVFFDYTSALNAPVNDDLYSIAVVGFGTSANAVGQDNVKPETTKTFEGGYRYQSATLNATGDVYYEEDDNHIVQSFNQQTNDSIDQNVGAVDYYGVEGIVGWTPIDNLTLIQSFAYNHSEYMSNIPFNASTAIPTRGKIAADTPIWMVAQRITYQEGNVLFGLQWKYVDKRYVTLVDDLVVPAYTTVDADFRLDLASAFPSPWIREGTYLQINALNIFNEKYLGSLNTTSTNNAALPYYSQPYGYQGAPTTIQAAIKVAF
jgi:iron complex outermembrane receptor protein